MNTNRIRPHSPLLRLFFGAAILIAATALLIGCNSALPAPVAQAKAAVTVVAPPEVNTTISPLEYEEQFIAAGAQHQLIDVRTPEEFAGGHIAGAVNIPLQELSQRLGEISTEQPVVLYCRSGNRSAQAAQLLAKAGYPQIYDLGGIIAWQQAGFSIE